MWLGGSVSISLIADQMLVNDVDYGFRYRKLENGKFGVLTDGVIRLEGKSVMDCVDLLSDEIVSEDRPPWIEEKMR